MSILLEFIVKLLDDLNKLIKKWSTNIHFVIIS